MRNIVPWTAAVIALVVAAVGSVSYRELAVREAIAQEQRQQDLVRAVAPAVPQGEVHRDIEVMRRILLQEVFGIGSKRSGVSSFTMVGHVFGSNTQSAEAFLVAGDGVTFVLRTSDAVAPGPAAEDTAEKPREETLWDRVLADVEGRPRTAGPTETKDIYDAEKVTAMEDEILAQLGRFGGRITGLSPSDHVTVVVVGGANPRVVAVTPSGNPTAAWNGSDPHHTDRVTTTARLYYHTASGRRAAAGRTVRTIRVAVSDLRRVADGSLTVADLRRHASIHAY